MHASSQIAVLTFAVAAFSAGAQSPSPTKQWPTATPQSVGLNPAVFDSIDAEAKSGRYGNVDRILVIRHGKIVFDRSYAQDYDRAYKEAAVTVSPLNGRDFASPYDYYNPWWHPFYRRGDLHTLQSVTKTVTSVVMGIAVTRGVFPSLDTPVLTFFDSGSVANVDDRKRRMTVRNLMTMTGGFDWNEGLPYTDPRNTGSMLELSNDWVKYTMDRPMSDEPGTKYNYNSGATVVQAHIFRRATGIDIEEYAARNLFAPLGIEHWYWKRTPTGVADAEGG
ncbi:MAG: serine hydrolase, partial [Bacteroidetes bacterium 13_1_20CM_4_60_6]